MNPETNNQMVEPAIVAEPVTKTPHPVNQVTTFSKCLAMVIFILMPFVGGYIGYQFGLQKAVFTVVTIPVQTNVLNTASQESATTHIVDAEVAIDAPVTQLNASSTAKYIVEEYECQNLQFGFKNRCYRIIERATDKVISENIHALAKEQSGFLATSTDPEYPHFSVRYVSQDGTKIYFTVNTWILWKYGPKPELKEQLHSLMMPIAVLDVNSLTLDWVELSYMKSFSSSYRYIAWVTEKDLKTINVTDLEVGKVIAHQTVKRGTVISSYCGMAGEYTLDISYDATSSSFIYGNYLDGEQGGNCQNIKIGEGVIKIGN